MFNKKLIAAGITLGLGLLGSAQAVTLSFTFDPTGTPGAAGDIVGNGSIDQKPGNVLSLGGGIPAVGSVAGAQVVDLYQANMNTIDSTVGGTNFVNGSGGAFFTFAAGYGEVITSLTGTCPGNNCTANFAFDPSAKVNFVEMNKQVALGNNLAGTGFTSATPGATNILKGHVTQVVTSFTTTNIGTPPTPADPTGTGGARFDNFFADDYAATTPRTIVGNGSGDLMFVVDWVDVNYFPDLLPGTNLVFGLTNTSLITPFNQADPSRLFSTSPLFNGDLAAVLGPMNGWNRDFQFQADANTSFIPEPGSLALLGLGLAGIAGIGRKRKQ